VASGTAAGLDTDIRAFVERYIAAWNGHDEGAIGELVTEDVVWADPALAQPARGIGELEAFMRDSLRTFPDLRFSEPDPPYLATVADRVVWAWRMQGTMKGPTPPPGFAPTGLAMDVQGLDMWTMRDGRIAGYRAFYDMNDLLRQLGIAPAPGSRAERAAAALQRLQVRIARR
jgi:steroid delta-isomerase-like uncharacterized protein